MRHLPNAKYARCALIPLVSSQICFDPTVFRRALSIVFWRLVFEKSQEMRLIQIESTMLQLSGFTCPPNWIKVDSVNDELGSLGSKTLS